MAKESSKRTVALSDASILKEMSAALQKNKQIIPSDKKLAQEAIDAFKKGTIKETDFINQMVYACSTSILDEAAKKGVSVDFKAVNHQSIMSADDVPILVKNGYDPNQPQEVGGDRPYSLIEYSISNVDKWVKIGDEQDAKCIEINKASVAIRDAALVISKEHTENQAKKAKLITELIKHDTKKKSSKKETREEKADRLLVEFRKYKDKENLTPEEKEKLALVQETDAALIRSEDLSKQIWKKSEELNDSDEKLVQALSDSGQTFTKITATKNICAEAKKSGVLDADNTQKADILINFVTDYEIEKRALYSGKTKEQFIKDNAENSKKGKGKEKADPKTAYINRIDEDKNLMASLTQENTPPQKNGVSSRLADASGLSDDVFKDQALASNQPTGKNSVLAQNGQQVHLTDADIQKTLADQKNGSSLA